MLQQCLSSYLVRDQGEITSTSLVKHLGKKYSLKCIQYTNHAKAFQFVGCAYSPYIIPYIILKGCPRIFCATFPHKNSWRQSTLAKNMANYGFTKLACWKSFSFSSTVYYNPVGTQYTWTTKVCIFPVLALVCINDILCRESRCLVLLYDDCCIVVFF